MCSMTGYQQIDYMQQARVVEENAIARHQLCDAKDGRDTAYSRLTVIASCSLSTTGVYAGAHTRHAWCATADLGHGDGYACIV